MSRRATGRCRRCAESRSRCPKGRSSPCSAPTVQARRRRSAPSRAPCGAAARSCSTASRCAAGPRRLRKPASRTSRRGGARSPSCRWSRTSGSAPTRGATAASRPTSTGWPDTSPGFAIAASSSAGTLSGGEQQMLALARALMGRPRLLMLDEPSLGLAPLIVREIFRIVRELNEKEGLTVLVVEQDARIALDSRLDGVRARGREGGAVRDERRVAGRRGRASELPRVLGMADFFQQVVSGLASGGIYGSLALAIVLIHRATGVINFAQGEMATFSTYIAWTLTTNHGFSYWPAFVGRRWPCRSSAGSAIHQVVIRPVERGLADPGRDHHDRALAAPQRADDAGSGRVRCSAVPSPFPARTIDIGGVAISVPGHRHDRRLPRAPS